MNSKIKRLVPLFTATTLFFEGIKQTLKWVEADTSKMRVPKKTNLFFK